MCIIVQKPRDTGTNISWVVSDSQASYSCWNWRSAATWLFDSWRNAVVVFRVHLQTLLIVFFPNEQTDLIEWALVRVVSSDISDWDCDGLYKSVYSGSCQNLTIDEFEVALPDVKPQLFNEYSLYAQISTFLRA